MGMNFKLGFFSEAWMFYVAIALIISIAPTAGGGCRREQREQRQQAVPLIRGADVL